MLLRVPSLGLGHIGRVESVAPVVRHLGQAKVENFGGSAPGHKDVRRLDVAVHNALGVRRIERLGDVNPNRKQLFDLQGPIADEVFQGLAFQVLHDDEGLVAVFPNVVDGADIGMIQGGRRLSLAPEAAESCGIARDIFRKELQRDKAVEARVFGLVNHAHPATTELFYHPVVRDVLADHFAHGVADLQRPKPEFG